WSSSGGAGDPGGQAPSLPETAPGPVQPGGAHGGAEPGSLARAERDRGGAGAGGDRFPGRDAQPGSPATLSGGGAEPMGCGCFLLLSVELGGAGDGGGGSGGRGGSGAAAGP